MKKRRNKLTIILILIVSTLFLIQFSSALTANSSNYSVSMFGTGMATGSPNSANYNSTFLSEAKGTTRNAENSQLTANIGFFDDTIYYRTVSITSYSISPSSAVVGSTIGLYISALNAQSVWAKITSPNAQQQTLNLINGQTVNYVPSPSVVGTYQVIFYANSSTGAIASVVDSFELTSQTTTPPSGGGTSGGGGTTTIIEKCTYNWDCTPWGVCSDGKQTRVCKNIGTCEGNESKPIEEMKCSEALFDIDLKLKNIELTENKTLKFSINLTEKIGIEKIDIHIKYSIINKEEYEIFSQIETKAVQGNLSYEKEIEEIKLVDGQYTLRIDIFYGNLQRAFAEQRFNVKDKVIVIEKRKVVEEKPVSNIKKIIDLLNNYKILIIIIIIISVSLRLLFIFKKGNLFMRLGKIVKSKRKYLVYSLFALLVTVSLIITNKLNISGKAIDTASSSNKGIILIPLIILSVLALLIIFRKKIIKFLSEKMENSHKLPKNSVKGLMNKKVYSEGGNYVGKVSEVILGENKIESLKIKIDKKHKFKAKGIIINYKQVKDVGEVIIIDGKVSEHLEDHLPGAIN